MAKSKTLYQCTECGGQLPKWQGQCPHCRAWNTLVETVAVPPSRRFDNLSGSRSEVRALSSVETSDAPRIQTGMVEFDRVLGGGFVPGEVVLLGGDPGIGKSTLLLQAVAALGASRRALYVTGEESVEQVALRAHRLGLINAPVELLAEVQLEAVLAVLEKERPELVVIDSIQTMYTESLSSAPGSVAQVRECAARFTRFAKERGMVLVLIGHVTKEGAIAGPRVLEHIVDAVLYFEGDTHSSYRLIRAMKNRFGAANELGVFGMTEHGLKGVANPSALFLSRHAQPVPGTAVMATMEGSRPLLVEIQALVDPVMSGMMSRRLAVGVDPQRLALLLAVLHRHGGTQVGGFDVFINVVGGVRIDEPAADLAVLMAIYSSYKNKALDGKLIVFGEVGLAGEIRPVQRGQERIREAVKLGFKKILLPDPNKPKRLAEDIEIVGISRIDEALSILTG
ncbi:MAG: DNA repair protein RadA [Proteobacteria bacterium]|nr:DNA repair protein RadA [Pseudomonadota bacterium]MCL2308533.1 DNA repair protein RadA [Pseudomonadota bacterium]